MLRLPDGRGGAGAPGSAFSSGEALSLTVLPFDAMRAEVRFGSCASFEVEARESGSTRTPSSSSLEGRKGLSSSLEAVKSIVLAEARFSAVFVVSSTMRWRKKLLVSGAAALLMIVEIGERRLRLAARHSAAPVCEDDHQRAKRDGASVYALPLRAFVVEVVLHQATLLPAVGLDAATVLSALRALNLLLGADLQMLVALHEHKGSLAERARDLAKEALAKYCLSRRE